MIQKLAILMDNANLAARFGDLVPVEVARVLAEKPDET